MFQLFDRTRRKLAISGFFFLCLLPTCAVAGFCLWRNLPWEAMHAAERLEQQLGLKVKLNRLIHSRPGLDIYEKLELLDPETGRSIFSCQSVEVKMEEYADSLQQLKPTLIFTFERPELDAAAFGQIGRLLESVLQDRTLPRVNCFCTKTELKLRRGKTVETYPALIAWVEHSDCQVQAAMKFYLPDAKTANPVELILSRDRKASPPQSRFQLQTLENEVPCELIALGIPIFSQYGPKTYFQGNLDFQYMHTISLDKDWKHAVNGKIINKNPEPHPTSQLN